MNLYWLFLIKKAKLNSQNVTEMRQNKKAQKWLLIVLSLFVLKMPRLGQGQTFNQYYFRSIGDDMDTPINAFDLNFNAPGYESNNIQDSGEGNMKEWRLQLTATKKVISIFFQSVGDPVEKRNIGLTRLWTGNNDPTLYGSVGDMCSIGIYDTGFQNLNKNRDCMDNVFVLRRTDSDEPFSVFKFYEIRLFEMQSLFIAMPNRVATIYPADGNLYLNSKPRELKMLIYHRGNSRKGVKPLLDADGTEGIDGCFQFPYNAVADTAGKIAFTINLDQTYYIQKLILVQSDDDEEMFGPYNVYVGDDSDSYTMNNKCASEIMDNTVQNNYFDYSGVQRNKLGDEVNCNESGQYVTIEAHLARLESLPNAAVKTIGLCSLGLIGTKFERLDTWPSTITMDADMSMSVQIPQITSTYKIGISLNMVVISDDDSLSWVTISDQYDTFTLNSNGMSGTHSIRFASSVWGTESLLSQPFLDTVQVIIRGTTPPTWKISQKIDQAVEDNMVDETPVIDGSNAPTDITIQTTPVMLTYGSVAHYNSEGQQIISIQYTFRPSAYEELLDKETSITVELRDSEGNLSSPIVIVYDWTTKAPFFDKVNKLKPLFQFYSGVAGSETLPEITWGQSLTESGDSSFSFNELEDYFSFNQDTRTLTFDDKGGQAKSLVNRVDLSISITLKNTIQYSRTYNVNVNLIQFEAPRIEDFISIVPFEVQSDQTKTLTTPPVFDGTNPNADVTFTMSDKLIPYITVTTFNGEGPVGRLYVRIVYVGSSEADDLGELQDLSITITLTDSLKQSSTNHILPVKVSKKPIVPPIFKDPLPPVVEVIVGLAKEWQLPDVKAEPYKERPFEPITVIVPNLLKPYLTFDASRRKLFWTDDEEAEQLNKNAEFRILITLHNDQGTRNNFEQLIRVKDEEQAEPPSFVDFQNGQVIAVIVNEAVTFELPAIKTTSSQDEVTIEVLLTPALSKWITYDSEESTIVAKPEEAEQVGFHTIKIVLSDDGGEQRQYQITFRVFISDEYDEDEDGDENEQKEEEEENDGDDSEGELPEEDKSDDDEDDEDESDDDESDDPSFEILDYDPDEEEKEEIRPKDDDEYDYEDEEDGGQPPTTKQIDFNPMTLWAMKELREKLKKRKNEQRFIIEEEEKVVAPPQVTKAEVSRVGEISLTFSQNMLFDELFQAYDIKSVTEEQEEEAALRNLRSIDIASLVYAEIERSSEFSAPYSMLNFVMIFKSFDAGSIKLQLRFENPLVVSLDKPDLLKFFFAAPELFQSKDNDKILDLGEKQSIEIKLPKQFPNDELMSSLSQAGQTVQVVTKAAMSANIFLTLFMSVSLKSMWNMVHVLQIIIFLPLVIQWPINGQLVTDSLEEALKLKELIQDVKKAVLPESWQQYLVEKEQNQENDTEEDTVKVPNSLIVGLGIFALVLAVLIILIILYCILKCFQERVQNCCSPLVKILKQKLFYSALIRFMIEGNLEMAYQNILFFAPWVVVTYEAKDETLNIYTRIGFICLMSSFVIFAIVFPLWKGNKQLQDEKVKAKYGGLYDGMKTESPLSALYTAFFCMRRLALVIALFYLKEQPFTLIYTLLIIQTLYFVYLTGVEPHQDSLQNRLEQFSEVCLIGLLYIMLFFINSNQLEAIIKWEAGTGAIILLSILFFFNFLHLIVTTIAKLLQTAKLQKIKQVNRRKYRLRQFHLKTKFSKLSKGRSKVKKEPIKVESCEVKEDYDSELEEENETRRKLLSAETSHTIRLHQHGMLSTQREIYREIQLEPRSTKLEIIPEQPDQPNHVLQTEQLRSEPRVFDKDLNDLSDDLSQSMPSRDGPTFRRSPSDRVQIRQPLHIGDSIQFVLEQVSPLRNVSENSSMPTDTSLDKTAHANQPR